MPVEGFNAFMPNDAIMVGTKDITLWFCICIGFVIAFNTRQKILGELHIQGNNSKKKKVHGSHLWYYSLIFCKSRDDINF